MAGAKERHVMYVYLTCELSSFDLYVIVRNSSRHVYDDCSMKKQPISAAVVLEFSELLNELQNHIETLASYLNM